MSDEVDEPAEIVTPEGDGTDPGYETLAQGFLSPRHRRLAQLAAEGRTNQDIAKELGYVGSRVSILLKNPYVAREIARLQERLFEETIQARLKSFAEPALNNISMILTDRTNKVKISEKAEMSKWVVEKLDGKAIQKTDIGENLLSVFMDRLDSGSAQRASRESRSVTQTTPDIEVKALEAPKVTAKVEEPAPDDPFRDWITDFCGASD